MIENVEVGFKELDRFKGSLPDSTAKEVAAFANTSGGTLYVGIRDDGTIVGVPNPDDVMCYHRFHKMRCTMEKGGDRQ